MRLCSPDTAVATLSREHLIADGLVIVISRPKTRVVLGERRWALTTFQAEARANQRFASRAASQPTTLPFQVHYETGFQGQRINRQTGFSSIWSGIKYLLCPQSRFWLCFCAGLLAFNKISIVDCLIQ